MPFSLILLRKINENGIHSLFYFAAGGGEYLLRQPPKNPFPRRGWRSQTAAREGIFRVHGGPQACHVPFPGSSGTD
jgi:hypothetical protein